MQRWRARGLVWARALLAACDCDGSMGWITSRVGRRCGWLARYVQYVFHPVSAPNEQESKKEMREIRTRRKREESKQPMYPTTSITIHTHRPFHSLDRPSSSPGPCTPLSRRWTAQPLAPRWPCPASTAVWVLPIVCRGRKHSLRVLLVVA